MPSQGRPLFEGVIDNLRRSSSGNDLGPEHITQQVFDAVAVACRNIRNVVSQLIEANDVTGNDGQLSAALDQPQFDCSLPKCGNSALDAL